MTLRAQYEKDGYLILENFYPAAVCDELIARAAELARGYNYEGHPSIFQTNEQARTSDRYFLESADRISFFFEKDAFDGTGKLKQDAALSFNKIGHALHDLDPVFNAFSRSVQLRHLASQLGLNNHVIMQSMYIFKHARIGGVVDVHQDSTFLYTTPDSCTGFWFALEDATRENGCLWAKPGGHHTALRERFHLNGNGGTVMDKLNDTPIVLDEMIPLEVKKGTCIVLHGLLPHYSLPNTSGKSRQAYAIHTVDKNAVYAKDNWLQRSTAAVGF